MNNKGKYEDSNVTKYPLAKYWLILVKRSMYLIRAMAAEPSLVDRLALKMLLAYK